MDIKGLTKRQLIGLIELQPEHIPTPFNRSKILKADLIELLLTPTAPFTTLDPPLVEEGDRAGWKKEMSPRNNLGNSELQMEQSAPLEAGTTVERGSDRMSHDPTVPEEPTIGDRGNVEIRLYVEDGRFPGSIHEKTSKTIHIEGILLSPDTIQIQTQDVLRELQAGFGAITGADSVRVGFQDPVSPDYTEFFVEAHPSVLHMSPTDPTTHVVCIESGNQLSLGMRVDFAQLEARDMPPHVDQQGSPLSSASVPLAPNDRKRLVQWLRSNAHEQDGYRVFVQSRFHSPPNSDICRSWKFAAAFSRHYYKQIHPFSSIPGKIKKSDIYAALEVGETWLSHAEEADRILQIFGQRGDHPSPEVISRTCESSGLRQGGVQLLQFLREWSKSHHPDLS